MSADEDRLNEIIAAYDAEAHVLKHRWERNETRRKYVALHPEMATELHSYFDNEHAADMALRGMGKIPRRLADFGNFERIEYIGHGGMGAVYETIENVAGEKRSVALKIMLDTGAATDAQRSRFRAEAALMASLDHPSIMPVYHFGDRAGEPYLVMKLLKGGNLAMPVPRTNEEQRRIAGVIAGLARALQYLHYRGMLHRDLKPDNILLDERGTAYIIDLGLAKRLPVEVAADAGHADAAGFSGGSIVGAAPYMSPELAGGKIATNRSDVYGLGAILYELLTGRPPYLAASWEETRQLVLAATAGPPSAASLNTAVDRTLARICSKCLEVDADKRYDSADELATALDNWLILRPQEDDPWPRRVQLWCRRNPAGVLLLVAVVAFLGLLAWRISDALQEPSRAQEVLAQQEARTLGLRLAQLRSALTATLHDPNHGDLADFLKQRDYTRLKEFVKKVAAQRLDLNGASPFHHNWFVLDREGTIVVHSCEEESQFENERLRKRDYFQGAIDFANSQGGSPVYVSRVYQSILPKDKRYKFSISAAIRDKTGAFAGVLAATILTGPDMGLGDLRNGDSYTALLAERDPSPHGVEQPTPGWASSYLVLLHPSYRAEVQPAWLPADQLSMLQSGATTSYRDPVGQVNDDFAGPWLAGFARVEGTSFVVVVQRRYQSALGDFALLALALVAAACMLIAVAMKPWRRARPRTN